MAIVGRATEMTESAARLKLAASGVAQVLLIEGEAGIGKTALATEVQRLAAERGFQVFAGAAVELERGQPFATIGDTLRLHSSSSDPRHAALGRLILGRPDTADGATFADVPDPILRIQEGVAELVEYLSANAPLLVCVEDVHWADSASLLTLRSLSRRVRGLPVLLMATQRPAPQPPELATTTEQLRRAGAVHLTLESLSADETAAMVEGLLDAPPGRTLRRELSRTGGNPLFIVEFVRALRKEEALEVVGGLIELRDQPLQLRGLQQTVLQGVHSLPAGTQHALRLAAVLGASFSLADLALLLDNPTTAALASLQPALDAGVIGPEDGGLRFRHELIRHAIYTDLPLDVRRSLHREAARSLGSAGRAASRVAQHLRLGAQPGDTEAVAFLRAAAQPDQAAALIAADLLQLAFELTPMTDPKRDEVGADLAEALVWGGRLREGEEFARQIVERGRGAAADKATHVLLRALSVEGRWGELVALVEPLLAAPAVSARKRGRLLAELALARLFCGQDEAAEADGLQALSIGEREADEAVEFHALYSLAAIKDFRGPTPDGVAYARRSIGVAKTVEAQRFHPHFGLGMCLHSSDDMAGAEKAFRAGLELGRHLGTVWEIPLYHTGLAIVGLHTGRWDDALADAETSVAVAEEVGTRFGAVAARAFAARIAVHRDELDVADALTAAAQAELDAFGPQWGAQWLMLAQAEVLEARGDISGALSVLLRIEEIFGAMIGVKMEMAPHIVRVALADGAPEVARAAAESVQEIAPRAGIPRVHVSAMRCRGLVDNDAEPLLEAVQRYHHGTRLLERASLLEDAGTVVGRIEARRAQAIELLSDALDQYQALGASRDVARTASRLRDLGVHRGQRGLRQRPTSGWASVTDTEQRVAALVVDGLNNRQIGDRLFISRYTVETHLKHLFAKLDLSSRVELAREVTRRGSVPANGGNVAANT
jgi:DNA-binding CsgD family transcriptional regulator